MNQATYRHLQQVLRDYPHITQYVRDRREALMYAWHAQDENIGGGKTNGINSSDVLPIHLASDKRLWVLEQQKAAVERTINKSPTLATGIVSELYFKDRPSLTVNGIALKFHVSVRSVQRLRRNFMETLADELGW